MSETANADVFRFRMRCHLWILCFSGSDHHTELISCLCEILPPGPHQQKHRDRADLQAFLAAVLNVRVHLLPLCVSHMRAHMRLILKSLFILPNPHTLHPARLGTLYQHTHSLQPVRALRHTLNRGRPSPFCPSIWLVPFVPHIMLAADGKLLQAGGVKALSWLVEEL